MTQQVEAEFLDLPLLYEAAATAGSAAAVAGEAAYAEGGPRYGQAQQAETEFFAFDVEQGVGSIDDLAPMHGEPRWAAGKGKGMNLAVGKAAGGVQLDGQDDFLQYLMELRESVYEVQESAQGGSGQVRRECFAKLRCMAELWRAIILSPEAAAMLAEIELYIG